MEPQQHPPMAQPFFSPGTRNISPIWRRFLQGLKAWDDEERRLPHITYTTNQQISTWHFGKTVLFNIGSSDVTATLPSVVAADIWKWLTIIRMGTGELQIVSSDSDNIEKDGTALACDDNDRVACNVTLQLVTETQWAILAGTGIWRVRPYAI